MNELNEKQLAIIDNYAVHILAGLINSPHFDPSEYTSTAEMMMQQCDLAYVYAEKLLISRNRYKQTKQPNKTQISNSQDEKNMKINILKSFIKSNVKESLPPKMPTISKEKTGLYDYYKQYFEKHKFEGMYLLSLSQFGKLIIEASKSLGMNVWKKRTSAGVLYNLMKIN